MTMKTLSYSVMTAKLNLQVILDNTDTRGLNLTLQAL